MPAALTTNHDAPFVPTRWDFPYGTYVLLTKGDLYVDIDNAHRFICADGVVEELSDSVLFPEAFDFGAAKGLAYFLWSLYSWTLDAPLDLPKLQIAFRVAVEGSGWTTSGTAPIDARAQSCVSEMVSALKAGRRSEIVYGGVQSDPEAWWYELDYNGRNDEPETYYSARSGAAHALGLFLASLTDQGVIRSVELNNAIEQTVDLLLSIWTDRSPFQT